MKNPKLINYSTKMCQSSQGTTVVRNMLLGSVAFMHKCKYILEECGMLNNSPGWFF
jgi:hypothetical protein